LTDPSTKAMSADPPFREIVDGDPDRGIVVFDTLLRPVYANALALARVSDAATAGLRGLIASVRDRADAVTTDLPLEVAGDRSWRVGITPLRRDTGRWFVARLAPSGFGSEPTIRAMQTRFRLTLRESEVAMHVAKGSSNSETARALGITEKTVKNALVAVYAKCGVRNRVELALRVYDAPIASRSGVGAATSPRDDGPPAASRGH
jgi:DNA-binding CsgD family transcriptional regulator